MFVKNRGVDPDDVVQPFICWVGNEGGDINSDTSPVSSHHRVESPGKIQ